MYDVDVALANELSQPAYQAPVEPWLAFLLVNQYALLRQRLAGRREVTAAVLTLMVADGIDQDAAYERLRVEAMNRRMPIEELAREYLARDTRAQGGGRRPRIKADDTAKKQSTNRRLRQ
jgi:hypothetical protein